MAIAGFDLFSCFLLLDFFPACLMELFFFSKKKKYCIISSMFFFIIWWLFPSSKSRLPHVCHRQPIASSVLDITSGPDLQSAPTPWMLDASAPIRATPLPRLLLACFACFAPGARLGLVPVWWRRSSPRCSCSFPVLASRSRGAILWSFGSWCRITTVPVHPPPPSFCGSNFTDTQHTDWFYKAGWLFSFCFSTSTTVTSGFSLFLSHPPPLPPSPLGSVSLFCCVNLGRMKH